jgi:hypothetical protein
VDSFALYIRYVMAVLFGIVCLASFNLSVIPLMVVAVGVLYFAVVFLANLPSSGSSAPSRPPMRTVQLKGRRT